MTGVLLDWDLEELVDSAELLVSEVATNAVVHASSDLLVLLSRLEGGVRVEVHDTSHVLPVQRVAGPSATGGRGMHLVEAVSDRWGTEASSPGKCVWFELAASSPPA